MKTAFQIQTAAVDSTETFSPAPVHPKKGAPLKASLLERLNRAITRHGHTAVMRATGLSDNAFWRARGGGPIHIGTELLIERGIDALECAAR